MPRTISRGELEAAVDHDEVVVLEALPPEYYEEAHLPGARNLPLDLIDDLAASLVPEKDAAIVTYCSDDTCSNSKLAAERLESLGYTNVRAYEAGKRDWTDAGLPLERGSDSR